MRKSQRRQRPLLLYLRCYPRRHSLSPSDYQHQVRAALVHQPLEPLRQLLRSKLFSFHVQPNYIRIFQQPVR